ncbi:MAG: hypothetical protein ACLFV6_10970 [Spirulinaceae cyanobacterium]
MAIFDGLPDPRNIDPDQSRSFPVSLQARGRKALQAIPGLVLEFFLRLTLGCKLNQ